VYGPDEIMAEAITRATIVQASTNQVSSQLGDEAVVLNVMNGVYYGLNPVSARIMELLEEPRSVEDIHSILLDEYEVSADQCYEDLVTLLSKLREHSLIDLQEA
jgi:hypothetical protein